MNKIEQLHFDIILDHDTFYGNDPSTHSLASEVTEDIAIKFKDWTELNEFWLEDDSEDVEYGWCSHKLKLYGIKSTKLLFNEFVKTL